MANNSNAEITDPDAHSRRESRVAMINAYVGGSIGALTTNVLHELVRRLTPEAPRVDLLGMQALAKLVATQRTPPTGRTLYAATLVGDIVSNAAYFSTIAAFPRRHAVQNGVLIGALAGIGAVVLPKPLALAEVTTGRTNVTKLLTVALYTAGGIAAGLALKA